MIDRTFHLIGIGGAGMSVVAELLQAEGATVTGSDAAESAVTAALRAGGIPVNVPQRADAVPEGAIVVVSSAIKDANPELRRHAVGARRSSIVPRPSPSFLPDANSWRWPVHTAKPPLQA